MIAAFSRAQIGLGSLCGVMMLAIVYELSAPLPEFTVPVAPHRDHAPITFVSPSFLPPSSGAFSVINERPIFSPGRKAVAAKPTGPAAAPPPPPSVTLVGVIMDAQNRLAMVKTSASPLEVSVGIGGNIDGWQVMQIEPDRIVLSFGAAIDEIRLEANRAKQEPPAEGAGSLPLTPQQAGGVPPPGSPSIYSFAGRTPMTQQMYNLTGGTPIANTNRPPLAGPQVLPPTPANGTDKQN